MLRGHLLCCCNCEKGGRQYIQFVLTLLVHLGYLTYDNEKETVEIPNREVSQEYINAISTMNWTD